jgi:hypothetical protein
VLGNSTTKINLGNRCKPNSLSRIKLKMMKMKIKKMSHLKRRTMIKGEMELIMTRKMIKKFRVKDRHTEESTKRFKEIT